MCNFHTVIKMPLKTIQNLWMVTFFLLFLPQNKLNLERIHQTNPLWRTLHGYKLQYLQLTGGKHLWFNSVTFLNHILTYHHHHKSLNREGRWGTTDGFATSFLHFSLFSTALWDLPNSRPVHSMMLSSHLFLCPPCLLPPFNVPCKMVLARPDEWETWPYHCSLRLFTIIRRSSCGPIACWILARTFSLVTWSLYEMRSILR